MFFNSSIIRSPRRGRTALCVAACASAMLLAACSGGSENSNGAGSAANVADNSDAGSDSSGVELAAANGSETVTSVLAENQESHSEASDLEWDPASEAKIELTGSAASSSTKAATVDGTTVTISSPGNYRVSGDLGDGRIVVNSASDGNVVIILDGVDITSSTGPAIEVLDADEVVVFLADGTNNHLSDTSREAVAEGEPEANGVIDSKADLTIAGTGSLEVNGVFEDGIVGSDGLVIEGGTVEVTAADDGVRANDYVIINDGVVTVNASGDGIRSDNEDDETRGFVAITGGTVDVVAGSDAVDATTDIAIADGTLTLATGDAGGKALVANVIVVIDGGSIETVSADDAIHSNNSVVINGGQFTIETDDDAVHADSRLVINGGEIDVTRSFEGLESADLTINAGTINITSSDDGMNAVGGNDGSGIAGPGNAAAGEIPSGGFPGGAGPGGAGPGGAGPGGAGPGADGFSSGTGSLTINGGTIAINAKGDGIDVNGPVTMTAGVLIIDGPSEQMNGALDTDGGWDQRGGFLVATGSSGMLVAPETTSAQRSLVSTFDTQPAGTTVHIESSDGAPIVTFTPTKAYQSIVVSTPEISEGVTYKVSVGGTTTQVDASGLSQAGDYQGGAVVDETTTAEAVSQGGFGGGGFRPPR